MPPTNWFPVPKVLATRDGGRRVREQAVAAGCTVLDFSATELLTLAAADELVCNGEWEATTGENPEVRAQVEKALVRRGRIPANGQDDAPSESDGS